MGGRPSAAAECQTERCTYRPKGVRISTEENQAIVGRWFTEFCGTDYNADVIDQLAHPDIRFEYSMHIPRRGRQAVREFAEEFREAFPDLGFTGTAELIAEGDYVGTMDRWRYPHRGGVQRPARRLTGTDRIRMLREAQARPSPPASVTSAASRRMFIIVRRLLIPGASSGPLDWRLGGPVFLGAAIWAGGRAGAGTFACSERVRD
jgi:hypothetical protein